jgi:hypothetical protein
MRAFASNWNNSPLTVLALINLNLHTTNLDWMIYLNLFRPQNFTNEHYFLISTSSLHPFDFLLISNSTGIMRRSRTSLLTWIHFYDPTCSCMLLLAYFIKLSDRGIDNWNSASFIYLYSCVHNSCGDYITIHFLYFHIREELRLTTWRRLQRRNAPILCTIWWILNFRWLFDWTLSSSCMQWEKVWFPSTFQVSFHLIGYYQ